MLVLLKNKMTNQYYYKIKRYVSIIKTRQYYYKTKGHVSIITKQKDMLVLLQNKKHFSIITKQKDILVFKK